MVWAGYSEKGQGGEERGPSTFTFVPPDVVRASPGVEGQAVPLQMGMTGSVAPGLTTQAPGVDAAGADRTLQMLTKVGEDILAPHMKRMREEQYLKGMQRAASGEAMTDIVNTQPWYTKIYGDAPLVEGARAYSVETSVGSWAAKQEMEMEKLRTHNPEAVPGLLAKSMQALNTGDAATDSAMQARALQLAPGLLKRQTKEHFKWQQETVSRQRVDAILTQGSLLNLAQTASPGIYTPEEIQQRKDGLMAVSTPTLGADPESWEKDLATAMGLMAEKGNFHGVAAFREAGVVSRMNPEKRLAVENMINRFEANHASDAAIEYSPRISQIKEDAQNGVISAKRVHEMYDAMNAEYRTKSGNSQPLIRKGDYVSDERAAMSAVYRMQRASFAAAAGQVDRQARIAGLESTFLMGGAAAAKHSGAPEAGMVDEVFASQWMRNLAVPPGTDQQVVATNYSVANKLLVENARAGYFNPLVKDHLERLSNSVGSNYHENFGRAYDAWKRMKETNGEQAQAGYFGTAGHKRFAAFDAALGGRDLNDPKNLALLDVAYQQARRAVYDTKELTKADREDVTKRVKDMQPGWGWFKDSPTPGSMGNMEAMLAPHYKTFGTVASGEQLFNLALGAAQANGLEQVGRYSWDKGNDKKPVMSYFQHPGQGGVVVHERVANAFDATLKEAAKERNIDPDTLQIYRGPDRGGVAYFQAVVIGGNDVPVTFSTLDVERHVKKSLGIEVPSAGPQQQKPKGIVYAPNYGMQPAPKRK